MLQDRRCYHAHSGCRSVDGDLLEPAALQVGILVPYFKSAGRTGDDYLSFVFVFAFVVVAV